MHPIQDKQLKRTIYVRMELQFPFDFSKPNRRRTKIRLRGHFDTPSTPRHKRFVRTV
jgi:hypothetical protein